MELKVYKEDKLISSLEDSKLIYSYIKNLKIDSNMYYNYMRNDCILKLNGLLLKIKNINDEKVILKIIAEKILEYMYKFKKPNILQINAAKDLYNFCLVEKESNELLNITLSIDENNNLTDISKMMLKKIISEEFNYWEQTFNPIKNELGTSIYYDDRKLIVDDIIFKNISSDVDKMLKSHEELTNENPFRRMKI